MHIPFPTVYGEYNKYFLEQRNRWIEENIGKIDISMNEAGKYLFVPPNEEIEKEAEKVHNTIYEALHNLYGASLFYQLCFIVDKPNYEKYVEGEGGHVLQGIERYQPLLRDIARYVLDKRQHIWEQTGTSILNVSQIIPRDVLKDAVVPYVVEKQYWKEFSEYTEDMLIIGAPYPSYTSEALDAFVEDNVYTLKDTLHRYTHNLKEQYGIPYDNNIIVEYIYAISGLPAVTKKMLVLPTFYTSFLNMDKLTDDMDIKLLFANNVLKYSASILISEIEQVYPGYYLGR